MAAVAVSLLATGMAAQAGSGAFMQTGKITSQPIGHYDFCKREPAECSRLSANTGALKLTQASWKKILETNLSVNTRIKPVTDMDQYGVEDYWTYPNSGAGDCEDYALEKQRELMQAGVPVADLLLTVVRKPDGEGHAVLTVRTDRGDYILDNLTDEVMRWNETDYTYLKRQAANNSGRWVTIEAPDNVLVGSVR